MFRSFHLTTFFYIWTLVGFVAPLDAADTKVETSLSIPSRLSVVALEHWSKSRKAILESIHEIMGPLPRGSRKNPPPFTLLEETICPGFIRRKISYQADPGDAVPAYLLIPAPDGKIPKRKFPVILALHQTHPLGNKVVVGLGQSPNDEYGVELVRRGFVVFAPAYPQLADYQPDLKKLGYVSGVMKAIWNNMRGLDLVESFPFVQKNRVGAIGHSLGGHTSIFTAVFDSRIKMIVTSCGFDSFHDYMNGDIRGWTSERYMPRLLDHRPPPFDFDELLALLAPRPVFISAPLGDTNFKWKSVDRMVENARTRYQRLHAGTNLVVVHPDCPHSFPPEIRDQAYAVVERVLK